MLEPKPPQTGKVQRSQIRPQPQQQQQQQQQQYGVVGGFSSHLHNASYTSADGTLDVSTDLGTSSTAGSAVSNLWTKASTCHHPLKLQLQHTVADVYYLPLKPKKRELKLNFDRNDAAASSSRSAADNCDANTPAAVVPRPPLQSLRTRVDAMLKKQPLFGKEREIASRLLAPYDGDGDSQRLARTALTARVTEVHIRQRKEKALSLLRKKAIADGTYIDDEVLLGLKKHPDVLAAEKIKEEMQEFLRNDDGSAAFDDTNEPCFTDLWADSGALTGCSALKTFQQKLLRKRWLIFLTILNVQATLQNTLAAAIEQQKSRQQESNPYTWTESDTAALVLQTQWRNVQNRKTGGSCALQVLKWQRNARQNRLQDASHASIRSMAVRQRGVGSVYSRAITQTRVAAATMIVDFMQQVYRSNRLKITIMIFCNGIRHLQGLVKRHLRSNRARLHALTALFDRFAARLTNHISVLSDSLGLDLIRPRNSKSTSIDERTAARKAQADKRNVLKLLRTDVLIGKISLDPQVRCLQQMKSASFHKLLRQSIMSRITIPSAECSVVSSSTERPELVPLTIQELNYHLKIHQGHFLLHAPLLLHPYDDGNASRASACQSMHSDQTLSSPRVAVVSDGTEQEHIGEGVLIDPSIRDEMLWAFLIKRRKDFVVKLGHRFDTGDVVRKKLPDLRLRIPDQSPAPPAPAGAASASPTITGAGTTAPSEKKRKKRTKVDLAGLQGDAEEEPEDEADGDGEPETGDGRGVRITLDQVRTFIQGDGLGNKGIDPLATKLQILHGRVAESQRVREWQRRTKMCNLTCLTTWHSMIRDLRTSDLLNLYLEMVQRTQMRRAQLGLPNLSMR